MVNVDVSLQEIEPLLFVFNRPLYHLDLLRYSRQLFFQKTIEFIEATPGTAFHDTDEDSSH